MKQFKGNYEIQYVIIEDDDDELSAVFVPEYEEYTEDNSYPVGMFMRSDSEYDGVYGLTNTSAIACIFNESNDGAALYLIG